MKEYGNGGTPDVTPPHEKASNIGSLSQVVAILPIAIGAMFGGGMSYSDMRIAWDQ